LSRALAAGAAVLLAACAAPTTDAGPEATGGTGGGIVSIMTGDAAAPGTGGSAPSGGSSGTGGRRGTGGAPGTGGAATGGNSGTGGMAVSPPPGSTLFPASAPWYQDISRAPLDPQSGPALAGLQAKGGWGTGQIRIDFSIEVLRAGAGVAARTFTRTSDFYDPDCDFMPVPVPPNGRLEGESGYACTGDGDCHLIVLQGTRLFEMWRANMAGATLSGGCLAVWDVTRDYWKPAARFSRGDQCSSADAAGYPIAALLFTPDEVKSGALNHAIRFILPNDRIRKGEYVHPATHSGAGKGTPTPDSVPYGARLRLKSTVNLASLPSAGARVVARALQKYGMFLADGGNVALTAQADTDSTTKWSGLLGPRDLASLAVSDFEMVDGGPRVPLTLDCVRAP
jgi:hypothetical protein